MDQLTDHLNWTNIVGYRGLSIWKGKASGIQEEKKNQQILCSIFVVAFGYEIKLKIFK